MRASLAEHARYRRLRSESKSPNENGRVAPAIVCPIRRLSPSAAVALRVGQGPHLGVEQGRAEVQHVAGSLPHQGERRRAAGGQPAGQRILLEGEVGLELLRQALHADIVGQADDLDRLDAVIARGALDAPEQLLADAPPAVLALDRKSGFGVNMASERRLFAPDRLVRAQFGRAAHMAVAEGPVQKVPLPEAMLGVMHEKVVRHSSAEAFMPAARIETQQMVAERFHVRRPKPADLYAK